MSEYIKYNYSKVIFSLILAIGIALGGYFIGNSIFKAKSLDNYIAVKGLSERIIVSDLAIWHIPIKATGNDMVKVNNKIELDRNIVVQFLIEQGFDKEEIEFGDYTVDDLNTNTYRNGGDSEKYRYVIKAIVVLKTSKVEQVKKVSKLQNLLVQKGITLGGSSYSSGPFYEFTNFNDIKLGMLEEAIKNARKAAEKIAEHSNTKIGSLKQANQGVFLMSPVDGGEENQNNDYDNSYQARRSISKKLRLVTTLHYFLKN